MSTKTGKRKRSLAEELKAANDAPGGASAFADQTSNTEADAEKRRQRARATWETFLAGLGPDSTDDDAQAAWRALHQAEFSSLQRERAEGKLRKALDLLVGEWKKVRADLERRRRREAAQDADAADELCPGIPLPDQDLVGEGWRYQVVADRVWVFAGDNRLWTPWGIVGAVTYPDRNEEHGLRVRVADEHGRISEFDIPADVAADKARLRSALALHGVKFTHHGMESAASVAAQMGQGAPIRAYGWGGWREPDTFLTAWGTPIGKNQNITVAAEARPKGQEVSGTFEGWRAAIDAAFATGLRQLQLSACAAFASPIIDLIKERSGTMPFTGPSGFGKSTGHEAQVSVWGDPAPGQGLFSSLNVSAQAPEVLLAQASGSGACADEVKHFRGSFQNLVFTVAGDVGRQRMRADTKGLRETRAWRLLLTMSYEHPVEHRVKVEDGEEVMVGLGARCLEIPIARIKLNHDMLNPLQGLKDNYGHAGPKFIQALIDKGYAADHQALRQEVNELAEVLLKDSETKDRRPAMLMAQAWRGAQIAQDAKLIPEVFPVTPPDSAIAPPPKTDGAETLEGDVLVANVKAESEIQRRDFPLGPDGQALDSLGQMIVLAWRLSRTMASASSDPEAKAVAALLRNLAMGRGVADRGATARPDTGAVRMSDERVNDRGEVFVIPMQHLPTLLDGSADVKAVVVLLRKKGLLLPYESGEGSGRRVLRNHWKHVPGFGPGPAIVIPVAKVTEGGD